MKKVLFTATVDSHILQFHIPYLKYFKEQGYEVHVATNGTEKIPNCDVKHVIAFERSPIKFNNLKAIKQLKKIIDNEKFDIIHTHTPMGSAVTRIAAKSSRKTGTRVIYTAHGFHFFKGAPLLNWIMFYPVEKFLSKYTDCLITINEEDYGFAKRKFKKCKQIELVPGVGVDEKKFDFEMSAKEKYELRKNLGLKDDDFILIQVGELNKNKNQIMSIKAMNRIVKGNDKIHLLLIGEGELKEYYKRKVKEYGLEKNIHILGYRNDIAKLMKISDVLLSLSYREGLPVNVIEGMMCTLPIIATDCRGNRDLIKNCIKINDISELIKRIRQLYEEKKEITYELSIYSKDTILKKISQIYISISRKKVLHLLSTNTFSGAENVACQIISLFKADKEYEMYYASPNGNIQNVLKEKNIQYIELKKIKVANIKKIIKKYNIDIIHAHDVRTSVISSFINKKIISHIHGNHLFMRKITVKSILYSLASKKFDSIIWVSKSAFDSYKFKNQIKEKSHILTNVINLDEIIEKSSEYNEKQNYDIAYIGRLSEAKNPLKMLNVLKVLLGIYKSFKCVIVGDGELRNKVEEYIKSTNLLNNIELRGYVDNPFPILKKSNLLIMTSIHEGTPMIALEALGLGVPIISTPTDGIKDLIDDKVGFLSNNDTELAKEIKFLLNSIDKRKIMSQNCKKKFQKINNIKFYKEKLNEIYR